MIFAVLLFWSMALTLYVFDHGFSIFKFTYSFAPSDYHLVLSSLAPKILFAHSWQ